MQHTANLVAGQWFRVNVNGLYAALLSIGAAASVEISLRAGSSVLEEVRTGTRGMSLRSDTPFDVVELRASVDCTVELVISNGRVIVDAVQGATVNVTATTPLPVSNDRGSPGNLLHVAGVSLADAPAVTISNGAPVACSAVAAVIASADANRRALRFSNLGPDPVAIGAAGITWANRCVVLQAGDVWIEDRAANLAWSGITDAAKSASVTVQGVTA